MPTTSPPSAAHRAYAHTKEAILTGRVVGGELLTEGSVAADLDVSRTPVREAFLRLEAEGWMKLYPKRGALVLAVPDGEREDIRDSRLVVETHAARTLAARGPLEAAAAADAMRAVLVEQAASRAEGSTDDFARFDVEFHTTLVEHAGNALLTAFYRSLSERQRRITSLNLVARPLVRCDIIAEHSKLADLVGGRQTDAFAELLESHLAKFYGTGR